MAYRKMTGVMLALALAAGTIATAQAAGRVGIALLPPMPVTTMPGGSVVSPTFPGTPSGLFEPPTPGLATAPPTTSFTPPQAVPLIAPGSPHR